MIVNLSTEQFENLTNKALERGLLEGAAEREMLIGEAMPDEENRELAEILVQHGLDVEAAQKKAAKEAAKQETEDRQEENGQEEVPQKTAEPTEETPSAEAKEKLEPYSRERIQEMSMPDRLASGLYSQDQLQAAWEASMNGVPEEWIEKFFYPDKSADYMRKRFGMYQNLHTPAK